jgi:hypothetical protein
MGLFSAIGDMWVRMKAKRDVRDKAVANPGDMVRDGKYQGLCVCAFFRSELDRYYKYCTIQQKRLWSSACIHNIELIERSIREGKSSLLENPNASRIKARLESLEKLPDTPERQGEIAEYNVQLDAIRKKAEITSREKLDRCIKPLGEINGVLKAYSDIVAIKKARHLQRMAEYWGTVQKNYHISNTALPPFRWSFEMLSEYYNLTDPIEETRKLIKSYEVILGI